MIRRILLVMLGSAAVCLVPWIVYLAHTLPNRYDTGQWRTAWVGFDVALVCCFAAATWLGLRRRRAAVPLLAATAALLCCDAWFDVVLDWASPDRWLSVALAVFAEIPIAILLLVAARRLLTGDMRRRTLTARDIEVYGDPWHRRLLREMPASAEELASRTGRPVDESLDALAADGFVRRDRDGRWHAIRRAFREPDPADFGVADRARLTEHLDEMYAREVDLLSWATAHRDEFGPWSRSQRGSARLTESELRELEAEYLELFTRYARLRRDQVPGERVVAVRFYAFPRPAAG